LASEPIWAIEPVGWVPVRKHRADGPCDFDRTSGGDRLEAHNTSAQSRGLYSVEEMRFLRWLRSEAWVPIKIHGVTRAIVCVAKGNVGHFTQERLSVLRQYEGFARAFYHLGELTEDRFARAVQLKHVASILPRIANSPKIEGFWRAVCT